jgi:hypothetical protein
MVPSGEGNRPGRSAFRTLATWVSKSLSGRNGYAGNLFLVGWVTGRPNEWCKLHAATAKGVCGHLQTPGETELGHNMVPALPSSHR